MSERFNVEESAEETLNIYDNEGIDDYYHCGNDERDVKALCKLLNEKDKENKRMKIQMQRLDHYFRDYREDEMNADNFSEMWDLVKEDERWDKPNVDEYIKKFI